MARTNFKQAKCRNVTRIVSVLVGLQIATWLIFFRPSSSLETLLKFAAESPNAMSHVPPVTAVSTGQTGVGFPPGKKGGRCVANGYKFAPGVIAPVVLITYNRPDYLNKSLESLFAVHGSDPTNEWKFPLFVSQDADHPGVRDLVWSKMHKGINYLQHNTGIPEGKTEATYGVYHKIAAHYDFVLRTFFDCFGAQRLIILEDDMLLAPDFFSYFEATAPLLDADESLLCVSSWNDNGQKWSVKDSLRLERTDFFPGLGWLINARVWDSIKDDWPVESWDDWLRDNKMRRNRQCIRPEVCRTYNIGRQGSSKGLYYKEYIEPIKLNEDNIRWQDIDLSYLQPEAVDARMMGDLQGATLMQTPQEALVADNDVVLLYNDMHTDYQVLAKQLRIMNDIRTWPSGTGQGIQRCSYKGIIPIRNTKGHMLFVAPTELYNQLLGLTAA